VAPDGFTNALPVPNLCGSGPLLGASALPKHLVDNTACEFVHSYAVWFWSRDLLELSHIFRIRRMLVGYSRQNAQRGLHDFEAIVQLLPPPMVRKAWYAPVSFCKRKPRPVSRHDRVGSSARGMGASLV